MVAANLGANYRQYVRRDVLVDSHWLEEHLDDPAVRVVEVDVSPAAYNEWHIDGACLWNIYSDLKDGTYRLFDKPVLETLFERTGIAPDSTVVFYGYGPAMGFWLMKLFGHRDARILNCARSTWRVEARACSTETPTPMTTRYPLQDEDVSLCADYRQVEHAIGDTSRTLVDVRTNAEFRGERFWPSGAQEVGGRAGHVPGATNLPLDDLFDERGAFRSPADLRQLCSTIDLSSTDEVISYCTIGGRASTAWFVLTYLLGRRNVRVYDGSWAEWGRMSSTPVESDASARKATATS